MIPPSVLASVEVALEKELGHPTRVTSTSPVGGGCINPSAQVKADTGEHFFLKWNDAAPEGMFEAEADGLAALASPHALRVPQVLGAGGACTPSDPGWLLLEFIPTGSPGPGYGSVLGEGLARLHTSERDPTFGWPRDNLIGSLHQENGEKSSWAAFWRDQRILPQLILAKASGYFTGSRGAVLQEVVERMEDLLPPSSLPRPELLHGDLWSGNYFPDPEGRPVLIDPAVYRGDGEVDLAMMELFGSFPRGFEEAYRGKRGLSEEYRTGRRDLYQLYYLLVHVNLFGGGYEGGSVAAAQRVLEKS